QTEVSENSFAKLKAAMPAEVTLQAYQGQIYKGRLRQIFPSADRAKSIVEVRVSILDPDAHVKPEMTASVTFQEQKLDGLTTSQTGSRTGGQTKQADPIILAPKKAMTEVAGQPAAWVVANGVATKRTVTLGADRIDQIEVRSGLLPGETVVLNPPAGLT